MNVEEFLRLEEIESGYLRLVLDAQNARVNVLSHAAIDALEACIASLPVATMKGLVIQSAKPSFVLGADITEFCQNFSKPESHIEAYSRRVHTLLNTLEDLPLPTVTIIAGDALGGGFELALATDYRLACESTKVGLPEVNLGILPGWGGTVRLPRLIGVDTALEWMTSGRIVSAKQALAVGAVDAVVASELLEQEALALLKREASSERYQSGARRRKAKALAMSDVEVDMACDTALGMASYIDSNHYPAPALIIKTLKQALRFNREEAQAAEMAAFTSLAKSPTAKALVNLFLNDQQLKKRNAGLAKRAQAITHAGVLGAGVMGGGVAYQAATTGTKIVMKDIHEGALDTGMAEANRLLLGQIKRGKLTPEKALLSSQNIQPTLDNHTLASAQVIVEAVVENINVKRQVLAETEAYIADDAVLATNTSTLTIEQLQSAVKQPERLCGMHFFNPVHRMPLVEIIRGAKTNDASIERAVALALSMKKVPVVVKDCSGFLVNRILLPYIHAFTRLVLDGVNFERIDRVMEAFGWPMGPATLMDIVGMDTGCHAAAILGEAYPDRLGDDVRNVTHALFEAGRLGQKSGSGYYRYEADRRGKIVKKSDPAAHAIVASLVPSEKAAMGEQDVSDQMIIDRLMIPMALEAVRCLDEGIGETAGDIDVSLINGIGFPRYLGGIFGFINRLGTQAFVDRCEGFAHLGEAYQVPESLSRMVLQQQSFFTTESAQTR